MGNKWTSCLLGDVINLKRGYDLPKQRRAKGVNPVVSSAGITDYHNEAKVVGPGVVTGRYGTIGLVFFIQQDFWPLNTTLYVKDFKGNDPRFISYYLNTLHFRTQNVAGAVPGVNRNYLHMIRVNIPSLEIQNKIAAILSAYDDLIENNMRRIKILEEMAQNLYREWFVNFRFPGHENTRFVDSPLGKIPEGWEVKLLKGILELKYGKALKKADRLGGDVPVYGSSGIVGYHNDSLVKGPGIIVGRKGNVGSVFWSNESFYPIDTVYYISSTLPLRFLYYELQNKNFINNDAAVPGLNRNQAYSLELVVPKDEVLLKFCWIADDFERQAHILKKKNANLRKIRDLLLPKLISGEVDVSELDIKVSKEASA